MTTKYKDCPKDILELAAHIVANYGSDPALLEGAIAAALDSEREAAIATCKTEAEICKKNGLPHEALGSLWCASAIGLQAAIRKRGA